MYKIQTNHVSSLMLKNLNSANVNAPQWSEAPESSEWAQYQDTLTHALQIYQAMKAPEKR